MSGDLIERLMAFFRGSGVSLCVPGYMEVAIETADAAVRRILARGTTPDAEVEQLSS